jgi:pseudaminic acid biosynthesis-associated methylase
MAQDQLLDLWRGQFGNDYVGRNEADDAQVEDRKRMWQRILEPLDARMPGRILEVGANLGLNLRALKSLCSVELLGLEPNDAARKRLVDDGVVYASNAIAGAGHSIPLPDGSVDLAFTCGVLIHVDPEALGATCREIHRISKRYVAAIEYFADEPTEKHYRGQTGALFKRDFGSFWMDQHPDLSLVDYGFFWKRASNLDNLTWWLFEKRIG